MHFSALRQVPLALFALLIVLSGCSISREVVVITATPKPFHDVNPEDSVLTLHDVPSDFVETTAQFHDNAGVAKSENVSLQTLTKKGRITSYETQFERHGVAGMLSVDDVVSLWQTAAGAKWDYARVAHTVSSTPHHVAVTYLLAPSLGQQRTAVSFRNSSQKTNITDYVVIFRRAQFRVYLQVVAVTGTVGGNDVLHLAHIIDKRIKTHLA